jgi:hypothetical protein
MGIPVVDHIIFGNDKYYSFYEQMNSKNDWQYIVIMLKYSCL